MIDIKEIIANREYIEQALLKRLDSIDFTEVITWENERKSLQQTIDKQRFEQKQISAGILIKMKLKEDVSTLKDQAKKISAQIPKNEKQNRECIQKIKNFLSYLPNVPEDEVPAGGKENNEVLEVVGEKPQFSYKFRDHVELATSLNLVDYSRGAKMGGTGKWAYCGDGALLEWSLINLFISQHLKNGYIFSLPPHLLRVQCGYVAGQFPKFKDDVFYLMPDEGEPTHFLLPTSETALANLYTDEVLNEEQLPLKLFAYTPCYRKEVGSYRTNERGTIRGNQFNKVEMFHITKPEDSQKHFEEMVDICKDIMNQLGLHYRVSRLAAQDCSEGMAKTYDIEVWLPSINEYKEVSSVSTAHTFQAIRGNIRYKDKQKKKNLYVHTLNGSGLATSRVFPAIMEQYQQEDGRVMVPRVLQPAVGKEYFDFK